MPRCTLSDVSTTEIAVTPVSTDEYRVTVTEATGTTTHVVTARSSDVSRFGGAVTAESLVEASFRFLLDREPKESILSQFDLPVIARYFPEYPDRIADYLS